MVGQLGTRRGWAGTEKDPEGTPIEDLLAPLNMGPSFCLFLRQLLPSRSSCRLVLPKTYIAFSLRSITHLRSHVLGDQRASLAGAPDQAEAVSRVYDTLLHNAGSALSAERCPWFEMHSARLPHAASAPVVPAPTRMDAGYRQQGEEMDQLGDASMQAVETVQMQTDAEPGSVAEDLLVGVGQRLTIRFAPLKQAVGWTLPAVARAALAGTYDMPAETTKAQLQDLLVALLGDEQPTTARGRDFEFWIGRNGAGSTGFKLGGSGQRYSTLASAAVRSGGGLEWTVLVEVAPAAIDAVTADTEDIPID